MTQLTMLNLSETTSSVHTNNGNGAKLGFEEKLWSAADKMRGHMDPSDYKHIILGLIFLKYISDVFSDSYEHFTAQRNADPENPSTYLQHNLFWVPKEARWMALAGKKKDIKKSIDKAMLAIERENSVLQGVLPKEYARSSIDEFRLSELINLIGTISLGSKEARSQDIIGRVYEYFLFRFAGAEGNKGGEFYTPRSVVRLLVEMLEPFNGTVYDPCCGTAGMFIQSEEFIKEHGGESHNIKLFGQESNPTTWRLARMNLVCRGLKADLGEKNDDTFLNDLHPDLKADFILANPPFNMSYWGAEKLESDSRWQYGEPPSSNANLAWVQHIIYHLAPNGIAGFVLANGSMSSNTAGEGKIRQTIIEADLVDCVVALPNQLFYGTSISACLWFIRGNKSHKKGSNRRGQTLFIDARNVGRHVDRTHKELPQEEISHISTAYRAWRGKDKKLAYQDVPGFCKSASLEEIKYHKWALVPGRYVGFDERLYQSINTEELFEEMKEVEARLEKISGASHTAIQQLRNLLYG